MTKLIRGCVYKSDFIFSNIFHVFLFHQTWEKSCGTTVMVLGYGKFTMTKMVGISKITQDILFTGYSAFNYISYLAKDICTPHRYIQEQRQKVLLNMSFINQI